MLGIEKLPALSRELGRRTGLGHHERVATVDTAMYHEKAVNLYRYMYNFLDKVDVFEGDHFSSWEEKAFFTERVAVHFFYDVFPDNSDGIFHASINGERNKIDVNLLSHTRRYLPNKLDHLPQDSPEQIHVEELLDRAAKGVCRILRTDIVKNQQADNFVFDFQNALKGKGITSSVVIWGERRGKVKHAIAQVLRTYKKDAANSVEKGSGDREIDSPGEEG